MRYYAGWIVAGVLWGVASIAVMIILGTTPAYAIHQPAVCHEYYTTHMSLTIEYFRTDSPPGVFVPLCLPHVLGMDILAWTLGLGVWLFTRQGSPWLALGHLLDPHPILATIAVVLVNVVAGALLMLIPALFVRLLMWLGDLSNRPRSST